MDGKNDSRPAGGAHVEAARTALREGLEARRAGEVEVARGCYQRALELVQSADDRANEVLTRINFGALEHHVGHFAAAREHFERALELAQALGDLRRIAVCEGNLAALHLEQGRATEAEALLESALAHYRELDDAAGIGNQLGNLGMLYQGRGEYGRAVRCLAEAASAFERAGHAVGAASTLRIAGELHRRIGNTPVATEAFERALFLSRRVGDTQGEAYARRAVGQLRLAAGEIDTAIGHFRSALTLHEQTQDARGTSAAWLDLGQALMAHGECEEGLAALERAVSLARERGLASDALASSLLALGTQLAHGGQTARGLETLMEALALYKEQGDPHGTCASHLNRASVLLLLGRWAEVESTLDEAQSLASGAGLLPILPSIAALRAQLAQLRGELRPALSLLGEAVAGFEQVHKGKLAGSARIGYALLQLELGQAEGLAETLAPLAQQAEERGDFSALADALQAQARLHRVARRHDESLQCLDRALEVIERYRNPSALSGLLTQRAVVRLRQEHWSSERFERLEEVERDLERAWSLASAQGFEPRCTLIDVHRAELLRRQGELEEARALLDSANARATALGFRVAVALAWQVDAYLSRDERNGPRYAHAVELAAEMFEAVGAQACLDELFEDFGASDPA